MTPLFSTIACSTAIGLGLVTTPGIASPMQTARIDAELRGSTELLLVLNQEEFAGDQKQFKWGFFIDDDLLYIEGRYGTSEENVLERYGGRKAEVKQWTDQWLKGHDSETD